MSSAAEEERAVLRAVVVDDTPDIRLLLAMTLERDGDFEVVAEAGNGAEGVQAAQRHQPDLVLLDLAMPVMDGFEALPRIREACPHARVVVLSGFEAGAMAERAKDLGASGYLQKGTSPDDILDFLRELLPVAPGGGSRVATLPPAPGAAGQSAAGRAADLAPFGLLLLVGAMNGPPLVGYANETASALVGDGSVLEGRPLAEVSSLLSHVLERRRPDLLATEQVGERFNGRTGRFELVLRRDGADVLASLHRVPETEQAARLRQALSEAAHEIRNPVTVMVGVAEAVLERGEDLDAAQRAALMSAVIRQAAALDRMTDDLLAAARAQRGTLDVHPVPVDLGALLVEALGDLPSPATVELCGDVDAWVMADPTRLRQIVANLLSNAIKYGAEPYVVRVTRPDPDASDGRTPMVSVDVEDGGPGVDPEFRELLFDEFTRAAGTRAPGTGLGLFLVRALAQRQGGWADYEPREGGGSVFTFALPEAPPERRTDQAGRPDSV